MERRPYADEPLLSKAVRRRREFEREGDMAAPAAGCVEGASGASDAGAASAVAEPAVVEEEVDRLHGHARAPLPLQYECTSFPSFMSGLHLRARECHSRQERMVRSLWRLPALSERARKAATERERLHMCVHNVRGGHMWREQHTFSSAVWQAQRARAEHLELHGFGLVLFISFLYNPFLYLPLVKGSADVASVLRARLLNVQRASFVRFRALSARTPAPTARH